VLPTLEGELVKRARDAQGRNWSTAAEAAAELRRSFPEQRVGYEIGAAALRALRRFDEMTAVLEAGESHFSGQPWLLAEQARSAHARGNAQEARRLAAEIRGRFPENGSGYQIGSMAARSLCLFDEAASIHASATAQFADQAWLGNERALTAQARGDLDEAGELAAQLRCQFPENAAGYQIGCAVARAAKRFEDALSILQAAGQFSNTPWMAVERATIAQARGDWNQARELAAELRDRFPENPAGYRIGVAGARAERNLEDADEIASVAVAKFPDDGWPLSLQASNARSRGDFDQALRIVGELRAQYPGEEAGYSLGVSWLRDQNCLDEAQAALRDAEPQFSARPWFSRNSVELSNLTANRANAARLIEVLRGENWRDLRAPTRGADRIVVVLGLHRGGTSLCAKIVSGLGFSLGPRLLQPGFDNPDGYYEHAEINRLHETLLTQLGATWDTAWSVREALDANSLTSEAHATVSQLKAVVAEQIEIGGGQWAFKDPRTAWLLPIWIRLFDDLKVTPTWLLAVRNPCAVAASLQARNHMPLELGELLWIEHYLNALRHLAPQIALVVHYESWFSSPGDQIRAVARALDASPAKVAEIVASSVIADLRHNEPGGAEPILGLTREIYGWLCAQDHDVGKLQHEAQLAWRALETIGRAAPLRPRGESSL
jgi:tetratricopeptide (TPR) repeat protein